MQKSFYSYSAFLQKLNEANSGRHPSPDFTPHEEFHKHRWFLPKSGSWYYKLKDFKPSMIPKNPEFIKTVDDELKDAVIFFHRKRIPTTPSCSGHFCKAEEWAEKFDLLADDERRIRTSGLDLIDPEDGTKFHLKKDPGYRLPWGKKSFVERATEHSKFGVLGFYDPGNFFAKKIERERIPNSQIKKDGSVTLFLTSPRNSRELQECWRKFTESLQRDSFS